MNKRIINVIDINIKFIYFIFLSFDLILDVEFLFLLRRSILRFLGKFFYFNKLLVV